MIDPTVEELDGHLMDDYKGDEPYPDDDHSLGEHPGEDPDPDCRQCRQGSA